MFIGHNDSFGRHLLPNDSLQIVTSYHRYVHPAKLAIALYQCEDRWLTYRTTPAQLRPLTGMHVPSLTANVSFVGLDRTP